MSGPSQPVPIPDEDPFIGPEFVGTVVGTWMFGLFTLQVSVDIIHSAPCH
jgi:hypothetical protein